jgi:hypothetical protein
MKKLVLTIAIILTSFSLMNANLVSSKKVLKPIPVKKVKT